MKKYGYGGNAMNSLTITKSNGQFTIDSREVAEMTGVRHSDLLEKINGYVQTLNSSENGKFRSLDFFIPCTYTVEGNTKTYPCYLLTRKGCDMIANKMTGEKGVLFTAAYVTKFEEMERAQKPQCIEDLIIMQATAMKDLRTEVKQLQSTQQAIKDAVISEPNNWREDINRKLNKIAQSIGQGRYQEVRNESYKLLEQRAHVDLERRLNNYRGNLFNAGASQTVIKKACKLDIIEQDPKLREIYGKIVSEYFIKYVA
jgi:Rha family phage regulatory protein